MKRILSLLLFGIVLMIQFSFCQQDITGSWQGMLKLGPQESRVVLQISKRNGVWNAKAYILDLMGNQPIRIESVLLQDSSVKLTWDNGQGCYEAKISSDKASIEGIYTAGQNSLPVSLERATKETAWVVDDSTHKIQLITVDKNVKLEVLDWGGSGRSVILLAGLGNDAHVFDKFASKLVAAGYHVYGITRRGFSDSSIPLSGYSSDRLGDDVLAVMKALKLNRPVLVGHSVAGEELSSVGSRHPEMIAGLIYLDALYIQAYCDNSISDIFLERQQKALDDLKAAKTPNPGLLIPAGAQRYVDIKAPLLAIYAAKQINANQRILDAIKKNIPSAKLVTLPNADHYIFMSNEEDVLREMKEFISGLY